MLAFKIDGLEINEKMMNEQTVCMLENAFCIPEIAFCMPAIVKRIPKKLDAYQNVK
jgi:hypothetical protein